MPDRSIFQIDSEWTNDRSNTVKLASLRGRPQIVTMFFAQCQSTCPILVHSMTEIETASQRQATENRPHAPGVGVGLALVARFAELHGGRAWVEERPGGGASFKVFLPGNVGAAWPERWASGG